MARSERLARLLQALRTLRTHVIAERLGEELAVCNRGARDIESLRAAGATLERATTFGCRLTEETAPPLTYYGSFQPWSPRDRPNVRADNDANETS